MDTDPRSPDEEETEVDVCTSNDNSVLMSDQSESIEESRLESITNDSGSGGEHDQVDVDVTTSSKEKKEVTIKIKNVNSKEKKAKFKWTSEREKALVKLCEDKKNDGLWPGSKNKLSQAHV